MYRPLPSSFPPLPAWEHSTLDCSACSPAGSVSAGKVVQVPSACHAVHCITNNCSNTAGPAGSAWAKQGRAAHVERIRELSSSASALILHGRLDLRSLESFQGAPFRHCITIDLDSAARWPQQGSTALGMLHCGQSSTGATPTACRMLHGCMSGYGALKGAGEGQTGGLLITTLLHSSVKSRPSSLSVSTHLLQSYIRYRKVKAGRPLQLQLAQIRRQRTVAKHDRAAVRSIWTCLRQPCLARQLLSTPKGRLDSDPVALSSKDKVHRSMLLQPLPFSKPSASTMPKARTRNSLLQPPPFMKMQKPQVSSSSSSASGPACTCTVLQHHTHWICYIEQLAAA